MNDPDYIKELELARINSKFQLLDVPLMSPGKCSNCGASKPDGRKYLDFGLTLEYYGVVYICTICLLEAARLVFKDSDFTPVAESVKTLEYYNTIIEELERIQFIFVGVKGLLDELSSNNAIVDNNDSDLGDSSSDLPIDSETESSDTESSETKPRVAESDTESGRSDIPSLTDILGISTK